MKGEGKNCELAECAMRRRVSAEAHLHTRRGTASGTQPREEKKTAGEEKKKAGVLLEKDGRKEGKEDEFRKKVHKFSFSSRLTPRKQNFFSQKLRIFKTKSLPLRLIKHNFPFFRPHVGVHIARSYGATRTNRRKCSLTY